MFKNPEYFIGVDLGTNGIKAGIVDTGGKIIETSYWETVLESSGVSKMEQNIDYFYISSLKIIRDVLEKSKIPPENISSIAIDGQMGGIIGVDKNFNSVTGLDMGLDIKSEKYNVYIHDNYLKELISTSCGSPRNTPKIMWWKSQYPEIYKRITKFVTLNGYVNGKMCSIKADQAVMDYTLLSFFGNDDAENLEWSESLSDVLEIDVEKLPEVVEPWFRVGGLSKEAAEITGLLEGTTVVAGAGDQPAGFLGAGLLDIGSVIDISGSSTILQLTVDEYRSDKINNTVMYMPSVIRGIYHAFTYINGGGITLRWFRDQFLNNEDDIPVKDLYGEIEKKARVVPAGSEGLIFIPYMGGRQCPYSEELRGSWIGLNWGHRKEHLYRAILEALTYDYRLGFNALKELFPEIKISNMPVSGGSAKSGLFNQIKADIMGIDYIRTIEEVFAIRGSGIIAGYGVGAFKDLREISNKINILKEDHVYRPDRSNYKIYSEYFDIFKEIIDKPLKDIFRILYKKSG